MECLIGDFQKSGNSKDGSLALSTLLDDIREVYVLRLAEVMTGHSAMPLKSGGR